MVDLLLFELTDPLSGCMGERLDGNSVKCTKDGHSYPYYILVGPLHFILPGVALGEHPEVSADTNYRGLELH